MNEIVKANIKSRLEKALVTENLSTNEAAALLHVKATYLSIIKNPETWGKCGIAVWETILTWVNSGQGIREYSEKHGMVLPEKHEPKPGTFLSRVIEKQPVKAEVMVRVKPEALESRKKEFAERIPEPKRASKGELIDLLIKEKDLLIRKIEAINALLKYYTN
jgi:hypothetical protein